MDKTIGSERHAALIRFLIEKREEAGFTQADLARELNEYQSFVARLESGQRRIDVVEYEIVAYALGFDPASFFKS